MASNRILRGVLASSLSLSALTFFLAKPARATLGRDASSVPEDQAHMRAALRISRSEATYTVHEIKLSSGTVVREFVSPAGKVFGVAWGGPWLPDFRQLLGDYFAPIMQAPRDDRRRRGALVVKRPEVFFQSTGHMRSFSGRAYVPDMLPKGVDSGVIQ
jgi:Protein of unknown function (DUF2844)